MEADCLGEAIDHACEILERVGEGAARWHVRLSKPQQVGGDETKPFCELRDEIAEHVAGSAKTVQQQDCWRAVRPGFTIEDSDATDIHFSIRDRAQGELSSPELVSGCDGD